MKEDHHGVPTDPPPKLRRQATAGEERPQGGKPTSSSEGRARSPESQVVEKRAALKEKPVKSSETASAPPTKTTVGAGSGREKNTAAGTGPGHQSKPSTQTAAGTGPGSSSKPSTQTAAGTGPGPSSKSTAALNTASGTSKKELAVGTKEEKVGTKLGGPQSTTSATPTTHLWDLTRDRALVEFETAADRAIAVITRDHLNIQEISRFRAVAKQFLTRTHIPTPRHRVPEPSTSSRSKGKEKEKRAKKEKKRSRHDSREAGKRHRHGHRHQDPKGKHHR